MEHNISKLSLNSIMDLNRIEFRINVLLEQPPPTFQNMCSYANSRSLKIQNCYNGVKCVYVMVDCSFRLALCTENKCFLTLYYVLVGFEILGIPLSDTSKFMVKRKATGRPPIIKLLLSLWLLLRIIQLLSHQFQIILSDMGIPVAISTFLACLTAIDAVTYSKTMPFGGVYKGKFIMYFLPPV